MNTAALASELSGDPQGYGYAPYVTANNWSALLAILNFVRDGVTPCPVNSVTGPAATLTLTTQPKNTLLALTTGIAVRLSLGVQTDGVTPLASGLVTTWQTVLAQVRAADPGSNINIALISALGNPVAQNVITQAEYNAIFLQYVSRAVQLFGVPVALPALVAAIG